MAAVKSIEEYIERNLSRKEELEKLRSIMKDLPFEESIKWGMPSYGFNGKNLVGIGSFKNWSCLWLHNGSLLKDTEKVLENAQEGKTKGMRQWRFSRIEDIDENLIIEYLKETIENQKARKTVIYEKKKVVEMPKILKEHLKNDPGSLDLFKTYTESQKNEFSNYIIEAKREKTKLDRMEKIMELIKSGKTLNSLWAR